jgi:hypothetical protein
MSKSSVTKKSEAVPTTATQNFFEKYGQAAAGRSWIGELARFNKFGSFIHGAEAIEIPLGTKMVAYMNSFCTGWQRWENSRVVQQLMGPVGEGYVPPPRAELGFDDKSRWESFDDGRPRDPWQFTNTIVLKEASGDQFFTFTTNSKGGVASLGQLSMTFGRHMRAHPGEYPITALERGSYQHPNRAFGEIRYPIFKVVGHVLIKDLPPLEGFGPAPAIEGPAGTGRF